VRSGQIAAQEPQELVDITVEDGQPLMRVRASKERGLALSATAWRYARSPRSPSASE
jgi:hypothetical protein